MTREMLINVGVGETRIATVSDGRLESLVLARGFGSAQGLVGDIVLGRVRKVAKAMEAAFVDIGQARDGFLALRDAVSPLHEGEAVLVQVTQEPRGEKGARLTATITLPGRWIVLAPGRPGISISHRLAGAETRAVLQAVGDTLAAKYPQMGWIFRTASAGADENEMIAEAESLVAVWNDIAVKRKLARPPAGLYRAPDPIVQALRQTRADRILIDDADAAEAARGSVPSLAGRIAYAPPPLLGEALEEEIAALASSRVPLASGGWLTIEPTEALTAIDVNSGSFGAAGDRDETARAGNLEAAREIARQIMLRDIGGLIVVDFIQMHEREDARLVVDALRRGLAADALPVRISPMGEFGIVAVARGRKGPSLNAVLSDARVEPGLSAQSQALELLRRLERAARAAPGRAWTIRAIPAVAEWLTAHEADIREGLTRRGLLRVSFESGTKNDVF